MFVSKRQKRMFGQLEIYKFALGLIYQDVNFSTANMYTGRPFFTPCHIFCPLLPNFAFKLFLALYYKIDSIIHVVFSLIKT